MTEDHSMLARITAVIDYCIDQQEPATLSAIVHATGLPKPTVWRIAQSLTERGLLQRSAAGYSGGSALAAMGSKVLNQHPMRSIVTPHLAELHGRTQAAVWAVDVRSHRDWLLVGSFHSHVAARAGYAQNWGLDPERPAILASALGVLALASAPERADLLLRRGVPRLTPHTEVQTHRVRRALESAARSGEAVEHERFVLGWSCVAVPITDRRDGRLLAVLGAADRTPRFATSRVLRAIHASAEAISLALAAGGSEVSSAERSRSAAARPHSIRSQRTT